jgi:hypothetical protein
MRANIRIFLLADRRFPATTGSESSIHPPAFFPFHAAGAGETKSLVSLKPDFRVNPLRAAPFPTG